MLSNKSVGNRLDNVSLEPALGQLKLICDLLKKFLPSRPKLFFSLLQFGEFTTSSFEDFLCLFCQSMIFTVFFDQPLVLFFPLFNFFLQFLFPTLINFIIKRGAVLFGHL